MTSSFSRLRLACDLCSVLQRYEFADDDDVFRPGEDCSDAFELANHTENAREMMKQHCVGRLIDVSSVIFTVFKSNAGVVMRPEGDVQIWDLVCDTSLFEHCMLYLFSRPSNDLSTHASGT